MAGALTLVDDKRTPVSQEFPPDEFAVDITAKARGLLLSRNDFYSSLVRDMAKTAQLDWNSSIQTYRLQPIRNINMGFVSSREPPRYQVKGIMWTMVALFHTFNQEERFVESSWKTTLGAETMGVGNIFYRVGASTSPLSANSSDAPQSVEGNVTASYNTDIDSDGLEAVQERPTTRDSRSEEFPNRGDLSLKLDYRPRGARVSPVQVWTSFVYALLQAAEHDREESGNVCTVYNSNDNFTIAVIPRVRGHEDLKWHTVINCLWLIPDTMLNFQSGGRWAEMYGNIRSHGYNVGKFALFKGRIQPTELDSYLDTFASE